MRLRFVSRLIGLAAVLLPAVTQAAPLPQRIGACAETTIRTVGSRLEGVADSGTGVSYANGGFQVSYDVIPALRRSRRGDRVRLCLVSIPTDCPPGDERGRIYRGTNLRTGESWTAPDSGHLCGGA